MVWYNPRIWVSEFAVQMLRIPKSECLNWCFRFSEIRNLNVWNYISDPKNGGKQPLLKIISRNLAIWVWNSESQKSDILVSCSPISDTKPPSWVSSSLSQILLFDVIVGLQICDSSLWQLLPNFGWIYVKRCAFWLFQERRSRYKKSRNLNVSIAYWDNEIFKILLSCFTNESPRIPEIRHFLK